MSTSLTEETRAELLNLMNSALDALSRSFECPGEDTPSLIIKGLARRLAYAIREDVDDFYESSGPIREFRGSAEFKSLVALMVTNRFLLCVICGVPEESMLPPDGLEVLGVYIEKTLLRALFAIRYRPESVRKTDLIEQFISFLGTPKARRTFAVPLYHLRLDESVFDLQPFGRLRLATESMADKFLPESITSRIIRPKAVFEAEFETNKFVARDLVGVGEELTVRVCLIRLAVSPLISFNECYITHVQPWEARFSNHEVFTRVWPNHPGQALFERTELLNKTTCEELMKLFENLRGIDWRALTPWRIALNRLNEAVFKLETDSADAFLDIVIGLESVMVESDSLQESTYKVAVRTARYLETSPSLRGNIFRSVKKLYGLRSKIAHGRPLKLDEHNISLICEGANILGRVLRRMLEDKKTEINAYELDLL